MSQDSPEETPKSARGAAGGSPYDGQPPGQGQPMWPGNGQAYGYPRYQAPEPGRPMATGSASGLSWPADPSGPRSRSDDRTWAMLAYLSPIIVSFIGPLIIFFVKKDESPFVRYHAAQSLNMIITSVIYSIVLLTAAIVSGVVTHGLGFLVFFLVWLVMGILILVYLVTATVAANRGELYRVPTSICLRLVH